MVVVPVRRATQEYVRVKKCIGLADAKLLNSKAVIYEDRPIRAGRSGFLGPTVYVGVYVE